MHNNWVDCRVIFDFLEKEKHFCKKYLIEVANLIFCVASNYELIEQAILDFNKINYISNHTLSNIYIIYINKNVINMLKKHCNIETKSDTDFYITQCENGTWLLSSNYYDIGISLCINTREDQWQSPIIEQLRWHIATHVMHRLEKNLKFCFHSSAIKKNDRIVVFFGYPEAGKSTQVGRALANGWQLISDDRVIFHLYNGKILVNPFWKSLKLRGDVGHLPEIAEIQSNNCSIISEYIEKPHGMSKRYIFWNSLASNGGEVSMYYFLDSDGKNANIAYDRYTYLIDSLITFGVENSKDSQKRRFEVGNIIKTICSSSFVVLNGKKDYFENIK